MGQAFFFFVLGMYCAEYQFDYFSFADSIKWRWIIPIFIVSLVFYTKYTDLPGQCRCFSIISSCLILLKLSKYLISKEYLFRFTKYLAGFSFYLFAIHNNFISPLQKIWIKTITVSSPLLCLAEYFVISLFVIVFCTLSGVILKRLSKPVYYLLTGGRG